MTPGEVKGAFGDEGWDQLQSIVGNLMRPFGLYPEQYEVRTCPDAGQLAQLDLERRRLRSLFPLAGCAYWSELAPAVNQSAIAKLTRSARVKGEKTGKFKRVEVSVKKQTRNHYITIVKTFCNWMVADGRALASPLVSLSKQAVTDASQRRAGSVNELARLIKAAETGGPFQWAGGRGGSHRKGERPHSISGPERALVYRLAAETGLRASELRSLRRCNFTLDALPHSVMVTNSHTKNKREAKVSLRNDLAARVREHVKRKAPAAQAFNMPPSDWTAAMLRMDAEAAGIDYRDAKGHVLDFHALRHTYCTNIGRSGASAKTVQEVARHASITTTQPYLHTDEAGKQAALAKLPELAELPRLAEVQAATGIAGGEARNGAGRATHALQNAGANKPQASAPDMAYGAASRAGERLQALGLRWKVRR